MVDFRFDFMNAFHFEIRFFTNRFHGFFRNDA